jgi:hypothetical protein
MMTEVSDIATPDLVTETELEGQRIAVKFVGSAEAVTLDDLTTYLEAVHRAALETNAGEVIFDVRSLEFMSASCFRSMLAWMSELQRSPQYRARFVSDEKKRWQKRSLQTLASFGGELVCIE